MRRFLFPELNWVVRSSTNASEKLPLTWKTKCEKTFFRFVYAITKENIHESLIINVDQTGVILIPGGSQQTYETKGAKQVPLHGKEEKRALTSVLSTAIEGKVLPTQSVWKGKTARSLPNHAARQGPESKGHRVTFNPRKYWSSFDTTKQWFQDIIVPYRQPMITKHNLSINAKVIIYLDCWSVHRGKELTP